MARNLLKRLLSIPLSDQERYQELIRREAKIGGQLFGPVSQGRWREFFCLDEYTWIWHEEWIDQRSGKRYAMTTRYDVRPNGIFKSQGNSSHQPLSYDELVNFNQAVKLYGLKVGAKLNNWAHQAA